MSSTLKISFIAYNATSFLTQGVHLSPIIDIVCKLQQRLHILARSRNANSSYFIF